MTSWRVRALGVKATARLHAASPSCLLILTPLCRTWRQVAISRLCCHSASVWVASEAPTTHTQQPTYSFLCCSTVLALLYMGICCLSLRKHTSSKNIRRQKANICLSSFLEFLHKQQRSQQPKPRIIALSGTLNPPNSTEGGPAFQNALRHQPS